MSKKERRWAIAQVGAHGWTVHHENAKGYLQMRCGCGRHLVWLHKTPSNPNHFREKVAYMIRLCSTGRPQVP